MILLAGGGPGTEIGCGITFAGAGGGTTEATPGGTAGLHTPPDGAVLSGRIRLGTRKSIRSATGALLHPLRRHISQAASPILLVFTCDPQFNRRQFVTEHNVAAGFSLRPQTTFSTVGS